MVGTGRAGKVIVCFGFYYILMNMSFCAWSVSQVQVSLLGSITSMSIDDPDSWHQDELPNYG